jgi:hypothetical protein
MDLEALGLAQVIHAEREAKREQLREPHEIGERKILRWVGRECYLEHPALNRGACSAQSLKWCISIALPGINE